jgi:hypothetical protein
MKKLITLFSLLLLIGCAKDLELDEIYLDEIPESLVIEKEAGIKLESRFASDEVRMNVKINASGVFTIKVIDIKNQVVSKEVVKGEVGDNLFKVYINTLPISSYRLELLCDDEYVGSEVINLL